MARRRDVTQKIRNVGSAAGSPPKKKKKRPTFSEDVREGRRSAGVANPMTDTMSAARAGIPSNRVRLDQFGKIEGLNEPAIQQQFRNESAASARDLQRVMGGGDFTGEAMRQIRRSDRLVDSAYGASMNRIKDEADRHRSGQSQEEKRADLEAFNRRMRKKKKKK